MKLILKLTVPLVALSMNAWAEPTLYPSNLDVLGKVVNKTNSHIIADEADAHTVWVMPPNTATAKVSGLHTKNANMGFCAEMRDVKDYSRELSGSIKLLTEKRIKKQDELAKLQTEADKLRVNAEAYATERGLSALSELDIRIGETQTRLTELYTLSDKCVQNCDQISEEINDLVKAKAVMLKDRNELAKQNTADQREYTRRRKLAEASQLKATNAKNAYTEMNTELQAVQSQFRETFASFGKMEGARAAIRYLSSWDENIQKLRDENPGINFSKMKTQNALLMTELAGISDVDGQGGIKAIATGGVMTDGVASFPMYPESLSTNVVLSLIGACPMEHPEYFDLKSSDVQDIEYGVIITYDYQTVFTFKASATYNMYKMYKKIVSSGSSGGFFSSSSWSSVVEKNFFKDSFSVKWSDKENAISQEDKEAIEQEMRTSVFTRLANLAIPKMPNRGDVIAAAEIPQNGAAVASDALIKYSGGNVYAIGAGVVLKVLGAIFGSGSSSSSYTNIIDAEVTEKYEQTQKITKSWLTSYVKQ
ncbi:MAG: hypothetical protein V4692_00935 [Bdellovibrionota bacterium]